VLSTNHRAIDKCAIGCFQAHAQRLYWIGVGTTKPCVTAGRCTTAGYCNRRFGCGSTSLIASCSDSESEQFGLSSAFWCLQHQETCVPVCVRSRTVHVLPLLLLLLSHLKIAFADGFDVRRWQFRFPAVDEIIQSIESEVMSVTNCPDLDSTRRPSLFVAVQSV